MCLGILCSTAIAMTSLPALADFSSLKPGLYVARDVGCDGLGGAGTVDFDGVNFSGHYALCRTVPITGQTDRFQSTCIEAQGSNRPSLSDVDSNPDKQITTLTILQKSSQEFVLNGTPYLYCGAR